MSNPLIIDDQDASHVTYSGAGWTKGGTSHENDGTVMSSTAVGDSFTVTFTGTGISVFATTDSTSGGVVTSYSIDGGTSVQAVAPETSGDTYKQQLWQSPTLPSQEHKLVVQMVKVNSGAGAGEGTVWFDFFQVVNDPGQSSVNSDSNPPKTGGTLPSTTLQSSSSTSSASSTSSDSHQTSQTLIPDAASQKSSKSNTGPIIGGVVGGVFLLLLLLFLLFFLRRRSKKKALENWIQQKPEIDRNQPYSPNNALLVPAGYTKIEPLSAPPRGGSPFQRPGPKSTNNPVQPPSGRPSMSSIAPSNYTIPSQSAGQSLLYYQNPHPQDPAYNAHHRPFPPSAMSSAASTSMTSLPPQQSSDRKPDSKGGNPALTLAWVPDPIQHVDSGLRVVNGVSARPEELPPVYSAQ